MLMLHLNEKPKAVTVVLSSKAKWLQREILREITALPYAGEQFRHVLPKKIKWIIESQSEVDKMRGTQI